MKLKLPSNTKELLKEPNETLNKIIAMITQWDTSTMSHQNQKEKQQADNKQMVLNIMCNMLDLPLQDDTSTDETCSYCEKPHHTREQCWLRKSDEDLKDKVKILIPSLKKIYKAQEEILQQGGLKTHQEKVMRSTLHTLQGMTIGGNRIKKLMDTDRYHQGERIKSKESASARTQPRNLQSRGRVPNPQTTQDQEYEEDHQNYEDDYENKNGLQDEGEDDGQDDYENEYEPQDEGNQGYEYQDESQDEPRDEGDYEHDYTDNDEIGYDNQQPEDSDQDNENYDNGKGDPYHQYSQEKNDQEESDQEGDDSEHQDYNDENEYNNTDHGDKDSSTSAGEEYDEVAPVEREDHELYTSWSMQVTH